MTNVWKNFHLNYQEYDWIEKPSIFAEAVIQYFPKLGLILELGAGHGQDSIFFAKQGYEVVSTDIETSSLQLNLANQTEELKKKITVRQVDLNAILPLENASFDIVYAHLSLHYFDKATTYTIINEIKRLLKPTGIFAFLANSINDPEYNTGDWLGDDFFLIDKVTKRYFSVEFANKLTRDFQVILLDAFGETYKDRAKGVSNLVRFVGYKP